MHHSNKYLLLISFLISFSCNKTDLIDPSGIEVKIDVDTFVFAVIGDYGYDGINEENVANMVKSWNPDFIITTGDNNYQYGEEATIKDNISKYYGDYIYNFDADEAYQCGGKAFEDEVNRFFPSPGNHDTNSLQGLKPYLNFFTLPGNEEYYSFTWGDVAFYSLNSTATLMGVQEEWLKEAIAKSTKNFNIVYLHHSPYSSGKHGDERKTQFDYHGMGVDVVFSGHDHIYSRIERIDEEGLYYIINGASGKSLYSCGDSPLDTSEFSVTCLDADYGAMRGVFNGQTLRLEYFYSSDRENPIDELVLDFK